MTAPLAGARRNPWLLDALLAAALTGLSVVTLLAGARDIGSYEPSSVALLFLQTVPLVFLRRAPVAVLIVTGAATAGHALQAQDSLNSTLGGLIALFAVADRHERRRSAIAALAMGAMMGSLIAYKAGLPNSLGSLVQTELAVLVAWTLGTWARERRQYVGTVEDRAARAEREREERAQRAVADERERIARELHDIVTHHVSVIVIQAGAARRALQRRPDDAARAVDAIDATGRLALADMRRMLGILGTTPAASPEAADTQGLEPLPRLDGLGQLIESVRAAGLPVELSVEGERRPLDPGVELSAYRIVQEALTNTLKHAHGARARVVVRYEPAALEVRVADDGRGQAGPAAAEAPPDSGGRGLIGMRERVALFGGTLQAGPDGAGFRIAARLPLEARSTASTA